jgi:hypothetical protein
MGTLAVDTEVRKFGDRVSRYVPWIDWQDDGHPSPRHLIHTLPAPLPAVFHRLYIPASSFWFLLLVSSLLSLVHDFNWPCLRSD